MSSAEQVADPDAPTSPRLAEEVGGGTTEPSGRRGARSAVSMLGKAVASERAVIAGSLTALTIAYFCATISRSAGDHFWMDEVLAVFAARQSTLAGVWKAIWSGTDFSPPTYHFLLNGFVKPFAAEHDRLLWRFPSILAVYGAACCTFLLLAKSQLSRAASVIGFGMVLAFGLFDYAIQVRQYGLLAFAFAVALLVWSGIDERRSAKVSAGCLWLALSICLCLHFYGIVQVAAIGMAELAYAISRRRVRIAVWSALLLTVPVEAALYPLASHLAVFNQGDNLAPEYFAKPTLDAFLYATFEIVEGGGFGNLFLLATVFTLGAAALRNRFDPHARRSIPAQSAAGPSELHFVMGALAVLPLTAFALALFVTHSFNPRYMASAALLPAIIVPFVLDRLPSRRGAWLVLGSLILVVLPLRTLVPKPIGDVLVVLEKATPPLPIVVGEGRLYIELMEVAEPSIRSRLVYLTRPEGLPSPDPSNENALVRLANLRSDYQVKDEDAFARAQKSFYVLTRPKVSVDTTTPLLAEKGLLGPPLYAFNGIQLFRAAAPTHVRRSGMIP